MIKMKKIYLVQYNNGDEYPGYYSEFTFKYCYSSKKQALQAIEELKQDQEFLENISEFIDDTTSINFWVKVVELVD